MNQKEYHANNKNTDLVLWSGKHEVYYRNGYLDLVFTDTDCVTTAISLRRICDLTDFDYNRSLQGMNNTGFFPRS